LNFSKIIDMQMKDRFLDAVTTGKLGHTDSSGIVVNIKEFKAYFNDIQSDYINSFLPAATIEPGRSQITRTKYIFRIRKGVYRIHPDVVKEYLVKKHLT